MKNKILYSILSGVVVSLLFVGLQKYFGSRIGAIVILLLTWGSLGSGKVPANLVVKTKLIGLIAITIPFLEYLFLSQAGEVPKLNLIETSLISTSFLFYSWYSYYFFKYQFEKYGYK